MVAFGTGEEYTKACKSEPNLLAHILMHCDAADDTHLHDSDSDTDSDEDTHGDEDSAAAAAAAKKAKAEAKAKAKAEALQKRTNGTAQKKEVPAKDQKAILFETMGMVPSVPTGLEPLKVRMVKT